VEWEIQLDIKADDLSSFAAGMIEPSEAVEIEFEMQNDQDEFKEDAQSGIVEIKHYADTGAYEGEAAVRDGGAVGGTFDLVLKSGAAVKGSFFASFAEPEVDLP